MKPEKFTREWFVEQGRKGGEKLLKQRGRKYFKKLNQIKKATKKLST